MPIRPPANPTAAPARPKFGAPGAAPAPATAPLPMGFQAPPVAAPAPAAPATSMGTDIFDIPEGDFDPTAEAIRILKDSPVPFDDGDHIFELLLNETRPDGPYRESSWNDKKTGEPRGMVALALFGAISDEKDSFNGRKMYFEITSFKIRVGEKSTSEIAQLLYALGEQPTGRPKTDTYRLMELIKAGYNKCIIETTWRSEFPYDPKNPDKNKRAYKLGQENFPHLGLGDPKRSRTISLNPSIQGKTIPL